LKKNFLKSILKKYKLFISFWIIGSIIVLYLFNDALTPQKKLPIFQPAMVNYELVDSTLQFVKKFHKISNFKLINQNGKIITNRDYDNKIYVADFFFTTCPTICPIMTDNMLKIQNKILDDPDVFLLSHTVTPKIDSVGQLKKYSIEKGVVDSKWNLVTGDKKQIYELARKSYLCVKTDGDGGPYDMIHTENFILIDPDRRIRGFYDGTNTKEIKKLIKDISILKEEYFS